MIVSPEAFSLFKAWDNFMVFEKRQPDYEKRIIMTYQTPRSFAWLYAGVNMLNFTLPQSGKAIFKTSSSIPHHITVDHTTKMGL